jgi:hypothetical protein
LHPLFKSKLNKAKQSNTNATQHNKASTPQNKIKQHKTNQNHGQQKEKKR